jgi:predicted transposase YbfD/YdcC
MQKFRRAFQRLADPRAANARHELLEVLVIALAAVLCGAESCADMADFGHSKEGLLRLFLRLEHGIPSHDTFSRVFRLLKPQAFEKAFRRFMAAFAKANGLKLTGVVAVDGKALRGAYERGGQATPLHLVNVFAVDARMALAQQKALGRNETAGALEVLDLLSLEGCIVTADALHCHRAFAAAVRERGGDYVLAIKANRGRLFTAVTQQFARSGKRSSAEQIDPSSHDRHEMRRRALPRWVGSPRAGAGAASAPMRRSCATISCPNTCLPSSSCTSPAATGASRTSCIGCSTFISPRTAIAPERTTLPRTSPFCAGSLSTSCEPTRIAPPCGARSSAQVGTTPSFWLSSVICDSPASSGVKPCWCRFSTQW